jgi:hypothetical protein
MNERKNYPILPLDREARKGLPVWSGVMGPNYFHDAFKELIRFHANDYDYSKRFIHVDLCFASLSIPGEVRRNSLIQLAMWATHELDRELGGEEKDEEAFFLERYSRAIVELSRCSVAGNAQHCNGKGLVWDRNKSSDHENCALRHLFDHGTVDTDGVRHTAKVLWRVLAMLQLEIERDNGGRSRAFLKSTYEFIDIYGVLCQAHRLNNEAFELRCLRWSNVYSRQDWSKWIALRFDDAAEVLVGRTLAPNDIEKIKKLKVTNETSK